MVQLCSSHERSGQKLLAVQLPRGCLRFCMAVAPTARCRVMLNSLSSRSTPETRVGAACAGFPGPCHQGHPCSWPAGEHQVCRSASSGHASRRPQNGESSDLVSSGRGRAAPRPAAAWITAGRTWPCIQLRPRRLPAPTAPCIPHAPKTLTNRASLICDEVRVARNTRLGSYRNVL